MLHLWCSQLMTWRPALDCCWELPWKQSVKHLFNLTIYCSYATHKHCFYAVIFYSFTYHLKHVLSHCDFLHSMDCTENERRKRKKCEGILIWIFFSRCIENLPDTVLNQTFLHSVWEGMMLMYRPSLWWLKHRLEVSRSLWSRKIMIFHQRESRE